MGIETGMVVEYFNGGFEGEVEMGFEGEEGGISSFQDMVGA